MKKHRDGKENKRNASNLFKYVQPTSNYLGQSSKLHTKSVVDLDNNHGRYQKSARVPSSKENHHSSMSIPVEKPENDSVKSHSLKKFLSIFGGPANLNSSTLNQSTEREEKHVLKPSGRQVFTCNIKNMNVNMNAHKDKDHKDSGNLLVTKKDKVDNGSNNLATKRKDDC